MTLSFFHILLAAVAVGFLINAIMRFVRGETFQSVPKFLFSFALWSGVFVLTIFPSVASIISQKLHIGQNLNTLIFAGFVMVFLVIFRILSVIEKIERNISEIVTENALQNMQRKKDDMEE